MSSPTPGPWTARAVRTETLTGKTGDTYFIVGPDGVGDIASLDMGARNKDANARLIAAAPDLLAAASWLLNAWESPTDEVSLQTVEDAANSVRAAIEKAKGRA